MSFEIHSEKKIEVQPPFQKDMRPAKHKANVFLVEVQANVPCPLIVCSDLHTNAKDLIEKLGKKLPELRSGLF